MANSDAEVSTLDELAGHIRALSELLVLIVRIIEVERPGSANRLRAAIDNALNMPTIVGDNPDIFKARTRLLKEFHESFGLWSS